MSTHKNSNRIKKIIILQSQKTINLTDISI